MLSTFIGYMDKREEENLVFSECLRSASGYT